MDMISGIRIQIQKVKMTITDNSPYVFTYTFERPQNHVLM